MNRPRSWLAWALLCAACNEPAPPAASPAPPPVAAPTAAQTAALAAEQRERLRTLRLPRSTECGALGADRVLAADTSLVLEQGARCKLVYPSGAVAVVMGPARASIAPESESALVLGLGTVQLDLAAGALTPESGFWLALPGARVELVEGGRLVARVFEAGASQLAVVSGRASVTGQDKAAVASPAAWWLATDGALTRADGEVGSLEAAAALVARTKAPKGDRGAALAAGMEALRRELERAQAEDERVKALSDAHARAVSSGSPTAMELQAELARASGAAFAARRGLMARASAFLALSLAADGAADGQALARRALALGD